MTDKEYKSPLHDFFEWFDFRLFIKQRRLILAHSDLNFTTEVKAASWWKSPFAFALQGLILTTLAAQILSLAFGLLFKTPKITLMRAES